MKCPTHKTDMQATDTKFGKRFVCSLCDMVSWNGNTPADQKTREARMEAHEAFDAIWKTGIMSRAKAYRVLAGEMMRPRAEVHMAQFSYDECQAVIRFAEELFDG